MIVLPEAKEMVISVPQAMKRYFDELVMGGACVVAATIIALFMMYKVLAGNDPEWVRMIYFLVIALAFGLLIFGFRIVMDSQMEQPLAAKHKQRELILNENSMTISLALLEGKTRSILRKFKTGALRLEWQDIEKIELKEATPPPKAEPANMAIHVINHEDTLGFDTVVHLRRDLLGKQEEKMLNFCRSRGVLVA